MLDPLLLTVLLPLCGAGCLLILSHLMGGVRLRPGRFAASILALGVAAAALSIVLLLRTGEGVSMAVSLWDSSLLAESAIRLGLDGWLWPLGLVLSVATCSLLLAELGGGEEGSSVFSAIALALLSAGLAAIWSADPLTTVVSWALYDLVLLVGEIAAGGSTGFTVRRFAFGSLSILFLWAGVLAAGNGTGSVRWSLMPPGGAKMALWVVAGLLRLGAYPFHFSRPGTEASSASVATFLLGPVLGWALWTRLVLISGTVLADRGWLLALGVLTYAVGGFLGWAAESPQDRRSWIGMGICGAVIMAVVKAPYLGSSGAAGENALLPMMTLGAASWMLSVPVLYLGGRLGSGPGRRRGSWLPVALSALGALHLVGLPPTMGFLVESFRMGGLAAGQTLGSKVGGFVGQLFLVAAVARWLTPTSWPGRSVPNGDSLLRWTAHLVGLLCPLALLIGVGLVPTLLVRDSNSLSVGLLLRGPGLASWLLWVGALVLGGLLGWQDAYLRPRVSLWLNVLQDLVRMDWAVTLLAGAFEQGLAVLRAVDDVLGGRGALLWSLIMVLLAVLLWRVG